MAELFQANLANIGVMLDIQAVDFATYVGIFTGDLPAENVRTCSRPSGLLITMMVGITSGRRSRVTPGSRAMAGTTAMSASSCWSKRGMPLTRSRISRP